jgi:transposase
MSTLSEIEAAVDKLPRPEQEILLEHLARKLAARPPVTEGSRAQRERWLQKARPAAEPRVYRQNGVATPPAPRPGGRPRTTDLRAVLNAIFYLLRTGCQWRLLPREFPAWSTVYHYFRSWNIGGVWSSIQRLICQQTRVQAGRAACPSVVIMDSQSVKTAERGGVRGFDAHKRVKGRKRHILVDTCGLLIACRVEPADISDRRAASLLLGGLSPLFPNIRSVIADGGHQSRRLTRELLKQARLDAANR